MHILVNYLPTAPMVDGKSYGNGTNVRKFNMSFSSSDRNSGLKIEFDFEDPARGVATESTGLVGSGSVTLTKDHALALAAGILRFYTKCHEARDSDEPCYVMDEKS